MAKNHSDTNLSAVTASASLDLAQWIKDLTSLVMRFIRRTPGILPDNGGQPVFRPSRFSVPARLDLLLNVRIMILRLLRG